MSRPHVLFYLPSITPWWFDNIVARLIATLAGACEIHVMVAPFAGGTGIGPEQAAGLAPGSGVTWHIIDPEDSERFRTDGRAVPELLELVRSIDPDYTLCRTADLETPRAFPGVVRYLMEAGLPPLPVPDNWVAIQPDVFSYGDLPAIAGDAGAALHQAFAPVWANLRRPYAGAGAGLDRTAFCELAGLPADRKIIALPLEYEHEENDFRRHRQIPDNRRLVQSLLDRLSDDFVLAVTNHPLNELYVDCGAVKALIAASGARARLVTCSTPADNATRLLVRHCDGLIVENSKSIGLGAFFGKPMLRLSDLPTGDWLNAYRSLDAFLAAIATGEPARPGEAMESWLAFHAANNVFNPHHDEVDAADVLRRLEHPVEPARWGANLARYRSTHEGLFAC